MAALAVVSPRHRFSSNQLANKQCSYVRGIEREHKMIGNRYLKSSITEVAEAMIAPYQTNIVISFR